MRRAITRGDHVISWIETFCLYPDGPHKGQPVKLSRAEVLAGPANLRLPRRPESNRAAHRAAGGIFGAGERLLT
jgi:hypothetical protein